MLRILRAGKILTISVVVDKVELGAVVNCAQVCLSHSKTNTVGESLTKGTGGDLDT
jgi:hypothetical protein